MNPARRLAWFRSFLEMLDSGDALVGATPASLGLRGQIRLEIRRLEWEEVR